MTAPVLPRLSLFDPQRIGPQVFDEVFFGHGSYKIELNTAHRANSCMRSWNAYLIAARLDDLIIATVEVYRKSGRVIGAATIISLTGSAGTILASMDFPREHLRLPLTSHRREQFYTAIKERAARRPQSETKLAVCYGHQLSTRRKARRQGELLKTEGEDK